MSIALYQDKGKRGGWLLVFVVALGCGFISALVDALWRHICGVPRRSQLIRKYDVLLAVVVTN